jgi:hypothetical protein
MASTEYGTLYGTTGFFKETTRNLNLNVEALKYYVMSNLVPRVFLVMARETSELQFTNIQICRGNTIFVGEPTIRSKNYRDILFAPPLPPPKDNVVTMIPNYSVG